MLREIANVTLAKSAFVVDLSPSMGRDPKCSRQASPTYMAVPQLWGALESIGAPSLASTTACVSAARALTTVNQTNAECVLALVDNTVTSRTR